MNTLVMPATSRAHLWARAVVEVPQGVEEAMTFKAEVDHQEVEVASIGADGVDPAVEGVALPTTAAKTFVEVSGADAVLVMLVAVIPEQVVDLARTTLEAVELVAEDLVRAALVAVEDLKRTALEAVELAAVDLERVEVEDLVVVGAEAEIMVTVVLGVEDSVGSMITRMKAEKCCMVVEECHEAEECHVAEECHEEEEDSAVTVLLMMVLALVKAVMAGVEVVTPVPVMLGLRVHTAASIFIKKMAWLSRPK